jgi:hypothetical protein
MLESTNKHIEKLIKIKKRFHLSGDECAHYCVEYSIKLKVITIFEN